MPAGRRRRLRRGWFGLDLLCGGFCSVCVAHPVRGILLDALTHSGLLWVGVLRRGGCPYSMGVCQRPYRMFFTHAGGIDNFILHQKTKLLCVLY